MSKPSPLPEAGPLETLSGVPLPPDDGRPFASPWEARAFAIAVCLNRGNHFPWHLFAATLGEEIAICENSVPYYECWLAALERLAISLELANERELRALIDAFVSSSQGNRHNHEGHDDHHNQPAHQRARPLAIG